MDNVEAAANRTYNCKLSPEERTARAKAAAEARWSFTASIYQSPEYYIGFKHGWLAAYETISKPTKEIIALLKEMEP